MKKRYDIRLDGEWIDKLQSISRKGFTEMVEEGLRYFEHSLDNTRKALLETYEKVSDAIIKIEAKRDYDEPGIDADEAKTLEILNKCWYLLRESPHFSEKEIEY